MDGQRDHHTKSRYSERGRQISRVITYRWKGKKPYKPSKVSNKMPHRLRKVAYFPKQQLGVGGEEKKVRDQD